MRETIKAAHAFDVYWQMGDQRSLDRVAQELHKSVTLLGRWSREHGWQERIKQKQAAQAADEDARHQQLVSGVEQQLLTDGIELQSLAMGLARTQAPKGRLSPALAPLLAQARGMAMRGLRLPETITRTETTGANGAPMKVQHEHDVSFSYSDFAAAFAGAAGLAVAPGAGDTEPVDTPSADD